MNLQDLNKYIINLNEGYKKLIDKRVNDMGIEEFLNHQLFYLDCSRIVNNMRMMQTIGYPYKQEISVYLYVLENFVNFTTTKDSNICNYDKDYWINKLIERHNANIEYEKENPPIWYECKSKKCNKRKQKAKEGDIFPEETRKDKISKAEARIKAKLLGSNIGFCSFKIKKD